MGENTPLPISPQTIEAPPAPEGGIPNSASTNSALRDYSNEKAVFSFVDYNAKECLLHNLDKKAIKALTSKLRTVSAVIVGDVRRSYFKDKIERGGKYASLYQDLKNDVELYEIEYGDKGRIFGHLALNEIRVVAFGVFKHK